jgi:hypothetical protein
MKKLLAVSFCTTLAVGIAASAFADATNVVANGGAVTLDGNILQRGFILKDVDNSDKHNCTGYDGRVRIGATVKTSDAVTGRILLENYDAYLNDTGEPGVYTWGEDWTRQGTSLFTGGAPHAGMQIIEGWLQYMPANWGVKVGHMPLALGDKLFFDHTEDGGDDAIVAFMSPTEGATIAALAIKFQEGFVNLADDDIDGYVAFGTYKANEAANLGIWYTYLHENKGANATFPGLSMSNLGLTWDGKVDNISFKLDYEGQFGDIVDYPLAAAKLKAKGWAAMGEVSMAVDSSTIGALIGYGSGDNNLTDTDNDAFLPFLSSTRYQSTMVGYILPTPDGATAGNLGPISGANNTGLSNLLLVQLNGATNVTCPLSGKDLALKARLNWMKLNETAAGEDDGVGTELELFANWKLDKGLSFGLEGAYLLAGDAWKTATITSPDNAFFVRTSLELSF